MKLSTGRWVSGDDFFDRKDELKLLESLVCDGNHVLLTGQRRMGKTSVARELGRRLQDKGWVFLFTDVEGATCPEDVIARIAEATHPVRPISSVLEHDGYLEAHIDGLHIPFRLLKDWWAARFRDHHIPLESRLSEQGRSGSDRIGFRGQNSDPNRGGVR